MNPLILVIAVVFLAVVTAVLMTGGGGSKNALAQKRLKTFTELDAEAQEMSQFSMDRSAGTRRNAWKIKESLVRKGAASESALMGGGTAQQKLMFLGAVMVGSALIMLLVSKGIIPRQVQSLLPLAIVALLVPRLIRSLKIKKLRRKFAEQFPGAIRMMMNSLRAGHDIRSAFEFVAEEMPSPTKEEFSHVLRELNVGVNIEAALKNLDQRLQSPDVSIFVTGVLMNNKLGGNLTEILRKLEYAMRERGRLRKETGTLTGQARASAMVLISLVPGVSAMMSVINPEYMSFYITTQLGMGILLYVTLSVGMGAFVLFRMANVTAD